MGHSWTRAVQVIDITINGGGSRDRGTKWNQLGYQSRNFHCDESCFSESHLSMLEWMSNYKYHPSDVIIGPCYIHVPLCLVFLSGVMKYIRTCT